MASVGIPTTTFPPILVGLYREEALLADRRGALSHEATLVGEGLGGLGFDLWGFGFRVPVLGFKVSGSLTLKTNAKSAKP